VTKRDIGIKFLTEAQRGNISIILRLHWVLVGIYKTLVYHNKVFGHPGHRKCLNLVDLSCPKNRNDLPGVYIYYGFQESRRSHVFASSAFSFSFYPNQTPILPRRQPLEAASRSRQLESRSKRNVALYVSKISIVLFLTAFLRGDNGATEMNPPP
jgi:hypothetical protein